MSPDLEHLGVALTAHGLRVFSGFQFEAGEAAPEGASGNPARSVVMVGYGGREMWPHFSAWRSGQPANLRDPLDTWSKLVIGEIAARSGARAVFPSDRPYMPFQQWAMRAEGLKPSPLGILMHPEFGLWHAFRGALLFEVNIPVFAHTSVHACDRCTEKPCLSACPVSAYSSAGFAVERCRNHVRSSAGRDCRERGCFARNACPVGARWRYAAEQLVYHQNAFVTG